MSRPSRPLGRVTAVGTAFAAAAALALALPGPAAQADAPAAPAGPGLDPGVVAHLPDIAEFRLSPQLAALLGRSTVTAEQAAGLLSGRTAAAAAGQLPAATPEVGTKRLWPALDDTGNTPSGIPPFGLYLKEYTLQAKRPNIEVWVASGTDEVSSGTQFPAGDCRAAKQDPTVVTSVQAQFLADEFQDKMLPIESKAFSVAPAADGTLGLGGLGLGLDFRGDGNSTVTLVDNVRDPNFYDFENNRSYVAGFFAQVFNQLTNRNVMTIDAFDWLHRTGDNPKDEPSEDICQSRPARPRTYEGVFAHEYQHLLHSYTNYNPSPVGVPFRSEELFVNEGLSDMASMLVGYADPLLNVHQTGADGSLYCFQGYGEVKGPPNPNPVYCGGPENSLTLWQDQVGKGPSALLADYGNAWSFQIYLYDRYGIDFTSALHRDAGFGLPGLQGVLDTFAPGTKVMDVIHDYQLMNLLDNVVSRKGTKLDGAARSVVTTKNLRAAANYSYEGAYGSLGAGPNGADYVQLRRDGKPLAGRALRTLTFTGTAAVGDVPVENWMVRLVGIDAKGKRVLVRSFDQAFSLSLSAADLRAFAGYGTVVAVVSVDDSVEALTQYVPYSLTVNGVEQLGG